MIIRNKLIPFTVLCMVFLTGQYAVAGKIYQWTDEEGGIHYSDVPPNDTATIEMHEIYIDTFENDNVDPEWYSIINQADRMAERRRQTTEERLARKRLQLEEKRLALEHERSQLNEVISTQENQPSVYYYPYVPRHRIYPWRNIHHRPRHPHTSRKEYRGKFSAAHRIQKHHSKVNIRFQSEL